MNSKNSVIASKNWTLKFKCDGGGGAEKKSTAA